MIFGEYEKVGLVDKTWRRIRIVDSRKDTVDFYNWFYDDRYLDGSNTLYRTEKELTLDELNREIIRKKIEGNELKKVLSITKMDMH